MISKLNFKVERIFMFITLIFPLFLTSGCSDWRQAIGKEKYIPNEYSFIKTPKLTVPPGFKIDSNSFTTRAKNEESIIPLNKNNANQEFETLFDINNVPKDIRKIIDEETLGIGLSERRGIDILLGNTPKTGVVLDSEKETMRIKKNKNNSKSLLSGPSPSIKIIDKKKLNIK